MLTKLRDAFKGKSRYQTWYHYVRYSFLSVCYSNFVRKTLSVFEIFDFENVVTLKCGSKVTRGHRNRHVQIRHISLPINVP